MRGGILKEGRAGPAMAGACTQGEELYMPRLGTDGCLQGQDRFRQVLRQSSPERGLGRYGRCRPSRRLSSSWSWRWYCMPSVLCLLLSTPFVLVLVRSAVNPPPRPIDPVPTGRRAAARKSKGLTHLEYLRAVRNGTYRPEILFSTVSDECAVVERLNEDIEPAARFEEPPDLQHVVVLYGYEPADLKKSFLLSRKLWFDRNGTTDADRQGCT
ncbi:hypothetical protein BJY04DRAFT_120600 [Aspergillus karnatakaensis]|uniref:uncharacterized protein n=1 Tax=Aspergillus karnatakaensis TaxID=1810916 RepID=UPI003CCDF075